MAGFRSFSYKWWRQTGHLLSFIMAIEMHSLSKVCLHEVIIGSCITNCEIGHIRCWYLPGFFSFTNYVVTFSLKLSITFIWFIYLLAKYLPTKASLLIPHFLSNFKANWIFLSSLKVFITSSLTEFRISIIYWKISILL